MHLISLYFLTVSGVDYRGGEGASISTNRTYYCHPLPVSIVRRLLILIVLVQLLIKYSFSLPNYPKHKSLLIYVVGIPR